MRTELSVQTGKTGLQHRGGPGLKVSFLSTGAQQDWGRGRGGWRSQQQPVPPYGNLVTLWHRLLGTAHRSLVRAGFGISCPLPITTTTVPPPPQPPTPVSRHTHKVWLVVRCDGTGARMRKNMIPLGKLEFHSTFVQHSLKSCLRILLKISFLGLKSHLRK